MSDERPPSADKVRELLKEVRSGRPPFNCNYCGKRYLSYAGILYHYGSNRGSFVPKCFLVTTSRGIGSPCSKRKRSKKEPLTWAESQRLVEVDFEGDYVRVSIDSDLVINSNDSTSTQGNSQGSEGEATEMKNSHQIKTPISSRKGRSDTPRSKGSKSKRGKRSKAQTSDTMEVANPSGLLKAEFEVLENLECSEAPEKSSTYYRYVEQSVEDLDDVVEYDMDEEDNHWLDLINEERRNDGLTVVPHEVFEFLMDRLEKECFFESRLSDHVDTNPYNIDENAECCICNDGEAHNTNVILFCDMCNLAVHQECYGVPYIPEGQWLCRRCLHSPSCNVDCVLCPNKGGAFKQTSDNHWAHVICALWIPEVHFANTVFLEPIDSIGNVPAARWKLVCYICRQKGGACIQCAKANCYVAFHVTCAQQAGLEMKIEPPKTGDTEVRKLAYCDQHMSAAAQQKLGDSVVEVEWEEEEDPNLDNSRRKGKAEERESGFIQKARRVLEQKRSISMLPIVNIPFIPDHRLERIAARVSVHRKTQFIPKLVGYWKLKRQSRNGVPLLRRLQATSQGAQMNTYKLSEEEMESLKEQLTLWKALRHDLERARLLVELVRKREKAKKKLVRLLHVILDLDLCPLRHILLGVLEQLRMKDPADIFAEPVPLDEVRDYTDVIKHPMDFATMNNKVMSGQYQTLEDFEADFNLVWGNAMIYNQKDTVYYKAAVRIRDAGKKFLEEAAEALKNARIDPASGLYEDFEEPASPVFQPAYPDSSILDESVLNDLIDDEEPLIPKPRLPSITMEEQYELLREQLAIAQTFKNPAVRHSKEKSLRREIGQVRRQMKQQQKKGTDSEELTPARLYSPRSMDDRGGLANHIKGSLRLTAPRHHILINSGVEIDLEKCSELNEGLPLNSHYYNDDDDEAFAQTPVDDGDLPEQSPFLSKRRGRRHTEKGINMRNARKRALTFVHSEPEIVSQKRQKGILKSAEKKILKKAKNIKLRRNKRGSARSAVEEERRELRQAIKSPTSLKSPLKYPASLEDGTLRRSRGRQSRSDQDAVQSPTNKLLAGEVESSIPSGASETELTARSIPTRKQVETRSRSLSVSSGMVKHRRKRKGPEQWDRQLFGRKRRTQSLSSDVERKGGCPTKSETSSKDSHELRTRNKLRSTSNGLVRASLSDLKQLDEHDSVPAKMVAECLTNGTSSVKSVKVTTKKKPSESGNEYIPQFYDVVWAKCKGFKPYPALVVDPNLSNDGIKLGHTFIPSPSTEVLNARTDPEHYLVRFFDARKSWQWLPVSKIQLLGENKERDQSFISKSGQSKASVLKAYDRSIDHLRQIKKIPQTLSIQEPKVQMDDANGTQLTVDGSNRIGSLSRCTDSDDGEP